MLLRDCFFCENAPKLFDLPRLQRNGYQESHRVGHRHRIPNAIDGIVEQARKQEEQRHEEEQLAREREEDAFARLPYTLEKSSCDYLNAYQRKCESHNAQAVGGLLNQLRRTFCKERHERRSEEEVNTKGDESYDRGKQAGFLQHLDQAIVTLCSIIEAGNGLHTLVKAYGQHHGKKNQSVGNAITAHGNVATRAGLCAIKRHAARNDDGHKAGAEIDQELRQTNRKRLKDDAPTDVWTLKAKMDDVGFVSKQIELAAEH